MAFTVNDFSDLLRLLAERPQWQVELRNLLLSDDFLALPQIVRELAEAQRQLAEAQRQLAEAQRRTEQRVEELAEAQWRTEQRVEELAQAQRALGQAFGQLQNSFGATVEEEAESVLQWVLENKGYRLLQEPFSLALNGEVDVVMELQDATGSHLWAVLESKARLSRRQVMGWAQQIRSSGWQQRLAAQGVAGPYLVYIFGIRIDPGTIQEAENQGIGLVTGRGERVVPKGLVQPSAA
ncbi:MAG: hypothetical protein HY741_29000 [Chloroflexi bacterium]|nr:hypothetical protein [Chloroflexota bacterium]